MSPGIHLLHKPVGPTSFSIVRTCKAASDPRLKICHGGTLDPFAGGLLLILVEPATKLFDYLHDVPKVYEATVRWGVETDNGDPHGRVVSEGDASHLSERQLDDALQEFIGWREQTPHTTSAKRIAGERAYVKAHRGETFEMPAARVYLHEARWLAHDLPHHQSRLRITVRGGYYVRALARDLGRRVGCGAHLTTLHRTAIGPWNDPEPDRSVHVQGRELLPWLASKILTDQDVGELRQNRAIATTDLLPPDWPLPPGFPNDSALVRGFHLDKFRFLLQPHDDKLKAISMLE